MRLSVGTLQQVVVRLRVMIYRKHVQHESPKNFQLINRLVRYQNGGIAPSQAI